MTWNAKKKSKFNYFFILKTFILVSERSSIGTSYDIKQLCQTN